VSLAEVVSLNEAVDILSVERSDSGLARTLIDYELGGFTTDTVEIAGKVYHNVALGGESRLLSKGLPGLPNICRSIVIPDDAEMSVRVISSHYVEYHDIDVAPSRGEIPRTIDPATVQYEFDAFYATDAWYPSELAETRAPYIMRDVRGIVVVLNPFQYNPASRTLRVYDRVSVEVRATGLGSANVLSRRAPGGVTPEFADIYERHFLNFESHRLARYTSVGEVGNMLVISYGDFMTAMEPLVEWKNQMGISCEMVSVTTAGGSATGIQSYIQDYYDANGLTFVLLVGDAAQMPYLTVNSGASDPSFSLVAGSDVYPDLFVGRFSAETVEQVETQVLRSVEYEKTPQPDADWYHKGTGIASDLGPGDDDEYDDAHVGFIREDLLGFTYTEVDTIYDPGATASMVANALNEGRSIINYTGHGSTGGWGSSDFANSHVNALTNDNMLPFIFSVACLNGRFTNITCFAETWLRATNGSEPTGAIATLMSSINQDWDEPMDAQDEMVDLLIAGAKRTFGGLSINGICHMLDEYGVAGENEALSWHIFGDPSLQVRTDTPASLSVLHAASMEPGDLTFDVLVDGVEGALCALSYDGVSYGAAFTDAGGTATINIDGVLPANEDIVVTVTSFNAIPHFGSVQVGEAYAAIIDAAPSFFSVNMESGGTATDTLTVGNVGEPLSVLSYSIEIADAGMTRNSDGSGITVDPIECEPGTTLDLVFTLANEGADGEWVNGASLDFPDGVVVNSSTDFVVSDRALRWGGASGDGAQLTWEGNWWNVVYPGETAVATVNVTVDAGFARSAEIVFGLQGDGHGDPPHALSGTLVIECGADPLFALLAPNGNEAWGVGEARGITWDSSGMPVLVDILCSVDGGGNWTTVVDSTADDGEHTWVVDAPVSDNCLVKVHVTGDPSADDVSDGSFSVYQPIEWLSVTPASGAVAAGATASVEVQFDTAGMAEGDYYADLVITNSGGEPVVIPVTLCVATTGTDDRIPEKAVVYGNFPNPFHPSTRIAFSIPTTTRVTVLVYSVDGRLVRTLTDDIYGSGRHVVPWNGKDAAGESVSDGVYFYKLVADGTELTGKMVLLR
ncbi:T9SS type A sorting domain-containing protein, partial [bacterium]|nr:T9SS type A sorting domain-containing protein [bacterium]